jgi:hypothetical protein
MSQQFVSAQALMHHAVFTMYMDVIAHPQLRQSSMARHWTQQACILFACSIYVAHNNFNAADATWQDIDEDIIDYINEPRDGKYMVWSIPQA